jgi:hypothetical protein
VNVTAPGETAASPELVKIGVFVMDFKSFTVEEGTANADFYLSLRSGTNVSLGDLELVNGHIITADLCDHGCRSRPPPLPVRPACADH